MTFDEWWELHGSKWALPNERLIAKQAWQAATRAEREECAKVCEKSDRYRGEYFAAKIRARSEKGEG